MIELGSTIRRIRSMKWLSPGSFILCALAFTVVFVVLHLAGLRVYTSILSGTLPAGWGAQVWNGFLAMLYVLFYMMTVIVTPILVIAAVIFHVINKYILK